VVCRSVLEILAGGDWCDVSGESAREQKKSREPKRTRAHKKVNSKQTPTLTLHVRLTSGTWQRWRHCTVKMRVSESVARRRCTPRIGCGRRARARIATSGGRQTCVRLHTSERFSSTKFSTLEQKIAILLGNYLRDGLLTGVSSVLW
jgi:hypothetical protein